ncbi:MAG: PIN domain-containing protein, partial [Pseudomonadota bacterium]|nr:PIN domain-containing protein [Pseudomonadota bacterium]
MAKSERISEKSEKIIVVDTNVILFDAQAIFKFKDASVHIPISVLEEIDRFKRDMGENGRNARQFSRYVDELRGKGPLAKGVPVNGKSNSRIVIQAGWNQSLLPKELDMEVVDNRILGVALCLQIENKSASVELISKDINLRIRADVFGVKARDYEPDDVVFEEMYSGYKELDVGSKEIDQYYQEKFFAVDEEMKLYANQYVILKDKANPNHSAIGRHNAVKKELVPLLTASENTNIWG